MKKIVVRTFVLTKLKRKGINKIFLWKYLILLISKEYYQYGKGVN